MISDKVGKKLFLPVLVLCSFLVGFDAIVIIPLLPTIARDINMSVGLGGLFVTAYAVAYALSAPVFGIISDRWVRKKLLFFGIIVFTIANALIGMVNTFSLFIILRVLAGIGAGMIEPVVYAIIGDNYPYKQRGRAMGLVTGALISASVIGVPIGGYIADWTTWKWTFLLIAFLSSITMIGVKIFMPEKVNKETNNVVMMTLSKMLPTVFSNSTVLFALLATLLYFGGLQGMFVNVGFFYQLNYDLTSSQIGLILMIAGIGSVIGSIVGGKLADRFGKRYTILFSSIIVALSVFSFSITTENIIKAIVINVIWATIYGLGQTGLTSLISEINPNVRGTIMALNSSAMYVGSGLFTAIAAFLLYDGVFLWVGILCGVANILVLFTAFRIHEQTNQVDQPID